MELGIIGPAEPSDFSPPWQPREWAVANHLHYSSVSSQFPSAKSYRVTHGIRMLVFSEKTIFQEPRLENCRILLRYAGGEDRGLEVDLRDLLNGYLSPMPVMDFVSKFEPGRRDRVLGGICRLALAGDVSFDISKPIDRHAMVYWSRQ